MSHRISLRSLYKLSSGFPILGPKKYGKGAWFLRFQHAWENIIVANASRKLLIMKMVLSRRCNGSWLLDAAELFGKGVAVCCYLPAFTLLPASYAWFIHSALLHLDRHPTKVQVFHQETFPPCSGQAFWYGQEIQPKMKPRYVFPTCGSSEKETSKLPLDTPNLRIATCSGELFVWLSEL